jgi:hypothetical protein
MAKIALEFWPYAVPVYVLIGGCLSAYFWRRYKFFGPEAILAERDLFALKSPTDTEHKEALWRRNRTANAEGTSAILAVLCLFIWPIVMLFYIPALLGGAVSPIVLKPSQESEANEIVSLSSGHVRSSVKVADMTEPQFQHFMGCDLCRGLRHD